MSSNRVGSERAPGRNTDKTRGYKRHGTPNFGSNGRQLSPSNPSITSYPPNGSLSSSLSCGILDSPESHQQLPLDSYSPSSPSDSQHAFTIGTPLNDSYVVDNDYMGASDWKSLLCPLSLTEDRLSAFSFYDDPYADSTLSPLHGLKGHPISRCDSLWDSTWSTSPDSVDSDLDSESVLSSSTSHLSPESSESDLCDPSIESEDEFEDDDNFYSPYPTSMSNLYPLDEQIYPSHLDHDALLPSSPPLPSQIASSSRLLSPTSPREQVSPLPLFHDYSFQLHDAPTIIPSSPSRRTSRELPEDEDDSFGSELLSTALPSSSHTAPSDSRQPFVRLRSLPGAETDDDLIPSELASKNYIPDAAPVMSDSLLLLDMNDLPPARCPSPEDFTLDLSAFAGLEGQEIWREMCRLNELRERTGKSQSWERERFRELSALLRLKTGMLGSATDNESAARTGITHEGGGKVEDESAVAFEHEQYLTSAEESPGGDSCHQPNAPKFSMTSKDSNDMASPPPLKSSPKPKITNMAQLVATMVFHRQQDAIRRPPARARTWAGPHYGNAMQTTSKTHPTPRTPLRQVSLPSDLEGLDCEAEDDGDAENAELSELFDSPLPLSPLMLADPPIGWLEMSQ